jgi:hypothetical protein
MRLEREYRSLPLWLAREYLIEVGGIAADDNTVSGNGWQAQLSIRDPVPIGALRIGLIQIVFDGGDEILPGVLTAFEKKAVRAGG